MHHKQRTGLPDWMHFAGQILAWLVVMAVILAMVVGCKSAEPEKEQPNPGPTFVRDHLAPPACSRCFERPELGHAS